MVAGVFTGVWLSHLVVLRPLEFVFELASDKSWSTLWRFAAGVTKGSVTLETGSSSSPMLSMTSDGLSVLNSFSKQSFARMLVNSVMVRDACIDGAHANSQSPSCQQQVSQQF